MNIADISSLLNPLANSIGNTANSNTGGVNQSVKQSFSQILKDQLEEADVLQKNADQMTEAFLTGEPVELYQVVIASEKADLAIRQTVELRNRVIDAYKQIANMQI